MPPPTAIFKKISWLGPDSVGRRMAAVIGIFFVAWLVLMASSKRIRMYSLAYLGSSEAMFELAEYYYQFPGDYYREPNYHNKNNAYIGPSFIVQRDTQKGNYWLRKSLTRGNLNALIYTIGSATGSGGVFESKEQVYWLQHGAEQNKIPWCAEQLAAAFANGRYGLPRDVGKTGKARDYDNLAVELHRKRGTLKEHNCVLLPRTNPNAGADEPTSPFMQREIHPGIPRESLSKK